MTRPSAILPINTDRIARNGPATIYTGNQHQHIDVDLILNNIDNIDNTLKDNNIRTPPYLTNRILVGNNCLYTNLKDAVDWFNSYAEHDTEIIIDGNTQEINETISINSSGGHNLNIRGLGSSITTLKISSLLGNNPLFNINTNCDFSKLNIEGYTTLGDGINNHCFNFQTTGIYSEITDIIINNFYTAINDSVGADFFFFNFVVSDCTNGVEINYDVGPGHTTTTDIEVGNFEHCTYGVKLTKAVKENFILYNLVFKNTDSSIAVQYVGGDYVYGEIANIFACTYNDKGHFLEGFDFSLQNGRDANIEITANIGEEDASPHAKINVINNTVTWNFANSFGNYYKIPFNNTDYYTSKVAIASGQMTYLSKNKRDGMMWINGNFTTTTAQARNTDICIRKHIDVTGFWGNGASVTGFTNTPHYLEIGNRLHITGWAGSSQLWNGQYIVTGVPSDTIFSYASTANGMTNISGDVGLIISPTTIRTSAASTVQFGINAYLEDVSYGSTYELYFSSDALQTTASIQDLTWLFTTK